MSNFVISCGGTGGHLSPGISLAERLIEQGHRCWLIISKKDVDTRLTRKYPQLDFVRAPGAAFSLYPWRLIKFFIQQFQLILFSFRLLRNKRPDTIVAFGGFITVGITLAGIIHGCPVAIHEANRKPGKATRYLRRLAHRLYLPEGVQLAGVPLQSIKHLGYPLRKGIRRTPKESARGNLRIDVSGKLLVVLGGSQGAQVLNEWVNEHFEKLGAEGISIYCVTGLGKGNNGVFEYRSATGEVVKAYYTTFSDNMGGVLSSADLVLSRAGAGTIAELMQCQTPSVLVPYPYATDNHQLANARFLEQLGGSMTIEQNQISDLYNEVVELIYNDWLLDKFRQNLRRLIRGNSAELIANDLEKLSSEYIEKHNSKAKEPA